MKIKLLLLSFLASGFAVASTQPVVELNTQTQPSIFEVSNKTTKTANESYHGWVGGCLYIRGELQYCILK